MKELLEELKKFLATATQEKLERAWNEVEQFKDVGPSFTEFVSSGLNFSNPVGTLQESKISNNNNPEYASGFFNPLHHYYGKSFVCV